MRAEDVGWAQNKLVLGKHSGRNAFKSRLSELGIVLDSEEALNSTFARFKDLADKKHEIFDEDLQALVSDEALTPEGEHFKLVYSRVCSETGETPLAAVTLTVGGSEKNPQPPVVARLMRRSKRLSQLRPVVPSCCFIPSMPSRLVRMRRVKSRCVCRRTDVSERKRCRHGYCDCISKSLSECLEQALFFARKTQPAGRSLIFDRNSSGAATAALGYCAEGRVILA